MSDSSSSIPPPRTTGGGWRWEPPTPSELQEILPQYEVQMLVGRGGMGAVYKGMQLSLDRAVAIKLLPPAIERQDSAFAERFKNEAKLMGRMNHPAIVSVYDFGRTSDGQLYFVMEYVDGTDVQRMIAREGKLPPEHALAITAHLCDALGYAHKQGVVHRDIKPSNVLIDIEGRVKVADFGLAKLSDNNLNSGLTQTGMAMGTPDYVAPETLTFGSDVDGRADIYAVGVMLYQMLTGDIPRGMFKMPSQKFRSIDPRFDAIVRRALEHDREERYQTSHELRLALDVILTTPRAEPGQESSAVLPKQAPHTPGRTVVPSARNPGSSQQRTQPRHEPPYQQPPPPLKSQSSSTMPYVIAALLMLGGGGWFIANRQHPPVPPNPFETAETVPSTPPTAPVPKSIPNTPPKPAPVRPKTTPTPPPAKSTPSFITPPVVMVPTTPVRPVVTPPPTAPAARTPEPIVYRLSQLESQFQMAFERDVNATYSDLLSTLGTGYTAALEREMLDATKAARLDEAVALREEKQRFTTHKFMPSIDPASLHKAVVTLRNAYRTAEKKYTQQKDASSLPLYDRYIEVLTALEREVLSQGRSADASAVRIKRDDVTARRKQRAAKIPAGVSTFPQAPPAASKLTLFDGQSLNGWRIIGDADSFIVADGEIRSNSRPGNLIYIGTAGTTPVWKDFTLEIKIKCQDRANSGIWLQIPDPSTIINRKVTAFEVNIDERGQAGTGSIFAAVDVKSGGPLNSRLTREKAGLFGTVKSSASAGRFNQWQNMRISAKAGLYTVWIDGRQVNEWSYPTGWSPPSDTGYIHAFQGTIGLQSLNGSVAFKDISLELL